jgi:outer membrane protein TolC
MKRLVLLLFWCLILVPDKGHALTLEEGLKIVAETGRDVKIARSDEEVARSSVSLARSPWLPSVDLYGRETWLKYQPESKLPFNFPGAPNSIPMSQDQFLTYGVRATQLLYDFGKTSSSIDAATYGLKAREIETLRARNRAALEFIIAYYDLLESEKLLQVAGEDVQRYEAHKKDAEARYSAGVVTKNEVLEADVTLADSRQRYLTADNLRSLRASRLNSLLLRPLNDPVQLEEVKKTPSAGITLEEAWVVAESESPEIRVIDAGILAKEESIRSVQAEYMPNFFLSGGYEYQQNQYMVHQDNWSLIAGVNINLSSGGATSSRVGMGKGELLSLRITRDKIVDAVRLDVKSAYLDLQSSAQKIDVMKTSVAQAEENLRLQRLRYQEGVGTAIEVLDAVTLLSTAETNSWRALYGFERAEASLLYSMGRDLMGVYGK